jgi:hypothetical protein
MVIGSCSTVTGVPSSVFAQRTSANSSPHEDHVSGELNKGRVEMQQEAARERAHGQGSCDIPLASFLAFTADYRRPFSFPDAEEELLVAHRIAT